MVEGISCSRRLALLWRGAYVGVVLAFVCVGAGGCGSSEDSSSADAPTRDERQIRATVDGMKQALASRDARAVCRAISAQALRQFELQSTESGGCVQTFGKTLAEGDVFEDPRVTVERVEVNGRKATATGRTVRQPDVLQRALFLKEDGEWKVLSWFTDGGG